jgi:molybdate transport system substrate-binding protein
VSRRLVAAVALAVIATGCGGSSTSTGTKAPPAITVFAASSLTNAFTAEVFAFSQQSHQKVTFSFAGSQQLVAQIKQGAPADVVATADTSTMAMLPNGARARLFARSRLVIAVPKGNPKHIKTLGDLARKGLVVVLAAPSVPAGKYAVEALSAAHVTVHPKSLEDNVRGVLTKVQLGEADAGIVYATDVQSTKGILEGVAIPTAPIASYPILALHPDGSAFVSYLLSPAGQAILDKYGFLPPT